MSETALTASDPNPLADRYADVCVVCLSGGLDSAVCYWEALGRLKAGLYRRVVPVHFQYGSKHALWEQEAFCRLVDEAGKRFGTLNTSSLGAAPFGPRVVRVPGLFPVSASALTDPTVPVPDGHYTAASQAATVVPGRNLVFAAALAGIAWALARGFGPAGRADVVMGVHQGDREVYPDCRPEFVAAAGEAVKLATDKAVKLKTPILGLKKNGVVHYGSRLGVPFRLTRTCYKDQSLACGTCGACVERQEAFALNGLDDPIEYAFKGPLPEPELGGEG